MKRFISTIFLIFFCGLQSFTLAQEIQNIQFKDMKGKSYDLYNLLEQGKYVYVEMMFNG